MTLPLSVAVPLCQDKCFPCNVSLSRQGICPGLLLLRNRSGAHTISSFSHPAWNKRKEQAVTHHHNSLFLHFAAAACRPQGLTNLKKLGFWRNPSLRTAGLCVIPFRSGWTRVDLTAYFFLRDRRRPFGTYSPDEDMAKDWCSRRLSQY